MIDRKTIALINGEVDGANSPEESETLRQTLARDPEAKKLLDDLKKLERNFSSRSSVKPPATLKPAILRSIYDRQAPSRVPARRFSLFDVLFSPGPRPRLGFAFGGGLLAGIVLVVLYLTVTSHPSIDDRDVSGTILGSSESLQTAEEAVISGDGVQGKVVTEYSSTLSVLRANLTMRPDLEARFVFNPDGAKFKGIVLGDGFAGTLTQRSGLIEIGHGGGTVRVFFAPGASTTQDVRLQIVSSGGVLYERSIPLGKGK